MRGQVLLATAAAVLAVTLILVTALPRLALTPNPQIDDYAIQQRELLYMLKTSWEETIREAALLTTDPSNLLTDVEKLVKKFQRIYEYKMRLYRELRAAECGEVSAVIKTKTMTKDGYEYTYINETYIQVTCLGNILSVYFTADVDIEVKSLGVFGGVKAKLKMTVNNEPIYVTSIGSVLYYKHDGRVVSSPLFGTVDDSGRIWLFNTSNLLEVRVAIPTEFCLREGGYNVSVVAITPGTGAATLTLINVKSRICR